MELIKMPGKLIIAALFLLLCQALYAQEVGYYIEYNDGKPKFIQRLAWEKVAYALHYEVVIHVLDNGGYREYTKDTTDDDVLLVSLPPGKYRFSVTPYDLLKARAEPSEWREFEVFPALQPVISSFTPDVFYLDRITARELHISGDNLLEASEIYLQSNNGILHPEKVIIAHNKSATLVFDDMKLEPGSYDIHIKNPGGLTTQSGKFEVGYRKPLDFFLKLAWTPLFPIYREETDIKNPAISIAGASFSFEVISSRRGDINGGLELATSLNYFNAGMILRTGDDYLMDSLGLGNGTLYTTFDLNIVIQKRFNRGRMAVSFRFGVGGATERSLGASDDSDIAIKLNLGLEYMVRLYKAFYLETGLDFNTDISSDYPDFIKPRLGIVWQF
jgi:hypothetical protein